MQAAGIVNFQNLRDILTSLRAGVEVSSITANFDHQWCYWSLLSLNIVHLILLLKSKGYSRQWVSNGLIVQSILQLEATNPFFIGVVPCINLSYHIFSFVLIWYFSHFVLAHCAADWPKCRSVWSNDCFQYLQTLWIVNPMLQTRSSTEDPFQREILMIYVSP